MDELEQIRQRKMKQLMMELQKKEEGSKLASDRFLNPSERVWPAQPIHVRDYEYLAFLSLYPYVIIDCWAPWCGPCRTMEPVLGVLAKKYQGKIVVGKVNTDDNQILAQQLQVLSIPTLLFYKNALLVDRITGSTTGKRLEHLISRHFFQDQDLDQD